MLYFKLFAAQITGTSAAFVEPRLADAYFESKQLAIDSLPEFISDSVSGEK